MFTSQIRLKNRSNLTKGADTIQVQTLDEINIANIDIKLHKEPVMSGKNSKTITYEESS